MNIENWNIDNKQLDDLKKAYKNLYERSRQTKLSTQQQDIILDKLVDDLFFERLAKIMNEDANISKEKSISFYDEFKKLISGWKKELNESNP